LFLRLTGWKTFSPLVRSRAGEWLTMNDDYARFDLCISLVQRLRVKSTIQNFDAADGKINTRDVELLDCREVQQIGITTLFSIPIIKKVAEAQFPFRVY
jgi:hypothetical protein